MQLEYLYITSYRNIQNQEFNFGGKYLYHTSKASQKVSYRISREINQNFIPNFFLIDKKGFSNITAIVGENGAGKSNTLDFIREIISKDRGYVADYLAIFSGSTEEVFASYHTSTDIFSFDFEISLISNVPDQLLTIFYFPTYDFRIFPVNVYADDIDVSSNYLMDEDYDLQKFALDHTSQADIHKYSNSSRQIQFITSQKMRTDVEGRIKLPGFIDLVVHYNNMERGRQDFHNTPYEFREYYRMLDDKHRDEINSLGREESRTVRQKIRNQVTEIRKKIFVSWALYYLLRNLFSNIERSNHYLQEGRVKAKIEELSEKGFKEALIEFINGQNLFPKKSTLDLINSIVESENYIASVDDGPQNIKVARVGIEKIESMQLAYQTYLRSIYEIAGSSLPYGFIDFDWHGLSTGEKAYLDLFSRLYYAKTKIYNKINDYRNISRFKKFPDNIILLLDEAEIGFHLQWQKEYIRNLIKVVPLIFEPEKPTIQLIFTTHSPISLSDIPETNIIYLSKREGRTKVLSGVQRPKHSFGANIHDLMQDAFYLKNGFMGDFAEQKIQKAIDWCLNSETKRGASEIEKLISIIDEPIIKVKLSEMFAAKMGNNVERARLEAQRDYIQKRLNELDNNGTN
jgi:hypothetical protein